MSAINIFMDESGDLGFDFTKSKTSKHFVVTFLIVANMKKIDKLVGKVFSGFTKLEVKNHHGTLHAFKEKPGTRLKLLNLLSKQDVKIFTIRLNKSNVYTNLQEEKHLLYNYVVNILLDRMIRKKLVGASDHVRFVASKRETNKFLNENFSTYLMEQSKVKHKVDISIEIKTPSQEKGLQVADFLAWSFFRKYEHGDETYISIVKSKIVEENGLYE
jgi:Protein of unknown function (DUF3800)